MGHERRAMPERSKSVHGEQHLVLPAPPGACRVDVKGEHGLRLFITMSRSARRTRRSLSFFVFLRDLRVFVIQTCRNLQFPQLGKLQKDVIRVQRRDDETGNPVTNAAAKKIVPREGERRVSADLKESRAAAAFMHLPGGKGRVPIDG